MNNLHNFTNRNKSRNPNIDLIRIIGMFNIIINHLLNHGQLFKKYNKYKELNLLNIFGMWHISSFGVISGLIRNKTYKFSNLLYLWILVVFYSFLFLIKYENLFTFINNGYLTTIIYPVIHNNYWYFTAYFGMYPFLPFINSGISKLSKIEVKKCIYFMLGIFIIWSSYYKDCFYQNIGHSSFSLLIFYIFGAYIGEYIFFAVNKTSLKIVICIIAILIYFFLSLCAYKISIKKLFPNVNENLKNIMKVQVNSLPIVLQTFSITIFLSQITFNSFLTKIITFLGPLTFDIYLIHENPYVRNNYMKKIFNQYPENLKLSAVFLLIFKKTFFIFSICIFIAYLRNYIFKILKIKNICHYFEIISSSMINFLI